MICAKCRLYGSALSWLKVFLPAQRQKSCASLIVKPAITSPHSREPGFTAPTLSVVVVGATGFSLVVGVKNGFRDDAGGGGGGLGV